MRSPGPDAFSNASFTTAPGPAPGPGGTGPGGTAYAGCGAGFGSCGAARERCVFGSAIALGAMFGLMASPAARAPMASLFIIVGVPLMTFGVAAPARLMLLREVGLVLRGLEAGALSLLLSLVGRGGDARAVLLRQRVRVENAYVQSGGRLGEGVSADPLRFHHMRRLATLGALLATAAGVCLPLIFPATFTIGEGFTAPLVVALDVVAIGLASRIVTERMMVRLFEATNALGGGHPMAARARVLPLSTMLGAAMGAVGSLVVLAAAAAASAVETSWISDVNMMQAGFWFIRHAAPQALPLGIGIGAILGAGAGLAQPPRA